MFVHPSPFSLYGLHRDTEQCYFRSLIRCRKHPSASFGSFDTRGWRPLPHGGAAVTAVLHPRLKIPELPCYNLHCDCILGHKANGTYMATSLTVQFEECPLQSTGWRVPTASGLRGTVAEPPLQDLWCAAYKGSEKSCRADSSLRHLWVPFQAPSENASAAGLEVNAS